MCLNAEIPLNFPMGGRDRVHLKAIGVKMIFWSENCHFENVFTNSY